MKAYVLENAKEFDRLEKQSQCEVYSFESELKNFNPRKNGTLLDAGCGSGIVSRYLAKKYPEAKVIGSDFSEQRVKQAKEFIQLPQNNPVKNLDFTVENLTHLSFDHSTFDGINCRYVLEHMSTEDVRKTLSEFYRCLRPNGQLSAIDMDGLFYNIYPATPLTESTLKEIQKLQNLDLNVGRKLPHLIAQAGFTNLKWEIVTLSFHGESLEIEMEQIRERFAMATPLLNSILGSPQNTAKFIDEYFSCLQQPGAVLFYNKFVISAVKSPMEVQK